MWEFYWNKARLHFQISYLSGIFWFFSLGFFVMSLFDKHIAQDRSLIFLIITSIIFIPALIKFKIYDKKLGQTEIPKVKIPSHNVTNVGELVKYLKKFPSDMKVVCYNGTDNQPPISVYQSDYKKDGINEQEVLIIDVD